MNMLAKAIQIASTAHLNELDKGGKPYILHPLWVMNKVRHLGEDYMIAAVLHDVVENSDWTIEKLHEEGFNNNIIEALMYLTHDKDKSYEDYIHLLSFNEIAKAVKLRDLEHNSKITRLKGLRSKDLERIQKYHRAYTYLLNVEKFK